MWFFIWICFRLFSRIFSRFEGNLNYTIQENHPSGIQVGYISSDIMHIPNINLPQFLDSSYTYMLRDKNKYFNLNSKTSVLKTALKIDLESLCPKFCTDDGVGFLNLVVNVWKDNQLRGVVNVKIVIHDQNDNVPLFSVKVFEKKIKEVLYGIGKVIELPKAIDRDVSETFSKVSYKLSRPTDTFKFQLSKDNNPRLLLIKEIDYETKHMYELTLLAWNPGQPDLKSYLEIKIEVIDINDCEPVFKKNIFELMLDENTKIGKFIIKLEAIDRDKDSQLVYGMVLTTNQINRETFAIKENGDVILLKKLDVEFRHTYEIPVYATDGEFTANSKIKIFVRDVNNHPPSYNLNPASLSIEENQPANILVGQITVKDVDSTEVNGAIRCQEPIGKSNLQDLRFQPDPAQNSFVLKYDMYSRIPLDREEASTRTIYLICHDGGLHERLTSTMVVSLQVIDINDNPPVFSTSSYKAQIKENNGIGDKVIQISAHDRDDKDNAIIIYGILEDATSSIFSINSNTGWITVLRELDSEEKNKYLLNVIAINKSPKVSFNVTATVEIEVIDENDNRPRLMPPITFEILENLKPKTLIGNIISEDKDSGQNGKVVYTLVNPKFTDFFDLKRNGSLYSKVSFDRELQEHYCLNIRVNDLGVPVSLSVTGSICVFILDTNDNTPVISIISSQIESDFNGIKNTSLPPNNDIIVASVHENINHKIATIVAHDADKDMNSKISFGLEDITEDNNHVTPLFTIDEEDGSIKISRTMSRDLIGEYTIKILAHDKGKPSLRTEKLIKIQIQDIPPQNPFNHKSNNSLTGNVLIVIILSTISAFLTALLIGAILCMIRPCCQAPLSHSNYQMDSNISNGQTLLQKLPPPYYNINAYSPYELSYESQWNQSLNRNDRLCSNITLDCYENNVLEKPDFMGYESPRQYMSQNTLCHVDHVVGKLNGCSCGQGLCIRYSTHPNPNCLSPNPEEQCSDSGRGASDDDMKALNINGISISSSRPTTSIYGTYSIGDSRSKSPRPEGFLTMNPTFNDRMLEQQILKNTQSQVGIMVPFCSQSSQVPLSTFHTSITSEPQVKSSSLRNSVLHLVKSSSIDSLSNIPVKTCNLPSPSNVDNKSSLLFQKKISTDKSRNK